MGVLVLSLPLQAAGSEVEWHSSPKNPLRNSTCVCGVKLLVLVIMLKCTEKSKKKSLNRSREGTGECTTLCLMFASLGLLHYMQHLRLS